MRPFTSTKKPLEPGHPIIAKKSAQNKQTNEIESPKKLKSSPSNRLLTNLTSNPMSKKGTSPVGSVTPRSLKKCPEMTSLSPRNRQKNSEDKPGKGDKKLNNKIVKEFRVFDDEEEVKIDEDFCEKEEEGPVAGSTEGIDKDSNNCSVIEGDEREREKLMEQIGWCAIRPTRRGTLKQREMFEQLNGSLSQEDRKTVSNQLTRVKIPEKEDIDNKQSFKSESPIARLKTREDEFCTGSSDIESVEQSFERSDKKIASSDIWNDTPRTEKSVEPKASSRKSKFDLEVYLAILNILRDANTAFSAEESLMELLGEYICLAPTKDSESFEKLFKNDYESKVIKSSFVIERLATVLVLYFTEELKAEKNVDQHIATLLDLLYENSLLFGHLMSEKIRDSSIENDWIEQLLDILENEGVVGLTKEKSFEKMHKNNSILSSTMKSMVMTLQHKEVMYGYNSIIVQADRIPPKEAYTRMLKSLSVYASERELKSQDPKLKVSVKKRSAEKMIKEQKPMIAQKEAEVIERSRETKKATKEEPVSYYLPKPLGDKKYTLVLDLDETLVHFAEIPGQQNELRVRPYVEYFLTEVSKHYEVVVFTTGIQEYADWVLDNVDKYLSVSHRLYRHHASTDLDTASFIKDLSRLGRDLSKVLIVDNLPENFRLQPDNGIAIKTWYDDHEDNALLELAPLLVEIARKNVRDVRVALRKFREQMLANIENGVENPHLNLNLDDSF